MNENVPGDRVSICELIRYIGELGDDELLRTQWASGEFPPSFDSLIGIIFDDFNIQRRATMIPGYLGTPLGLPEDLHRFGVLLDEFDRAHPYSDRDSDLELLDLPDWKPISIAAKHIANSARAWRKENCDP